jgi:fatty-acyl-CoA synthase
LSRKQLETLSPSKVCIIGVPDPKWGERPLAILVAKPGQEVSETQIRAHLHGFVEKGIITSYSVPDRIVVVEDLPKTSVGKLDKKLLRRRFAE